MGEITGGESVTQLTVTGNEPVVVTWLPSLTVSVMIELPVRPEGTWMLTVRFDPLPPSVISELAMTDGTEEVAVRTRPAA